MSWSDQKQYGNRDILLENISVEVGDIKAWVEIDQVWYTEDASEVTKYRLTIGNLFGSQSALFDDLRAVLVTLKALTKADKKDLPVDLKKLAKGLGYPNIVIEAREEKEETKV